MNRPGVSIRILAFCCSLLFLILAGVAPGETLSRSEIEEMRRMAELGSLTSQFQLWEVYRTGNGVEADRDQALEWLEKGAQIGYLPAVATLGMEHLCGDIVRQDFARAIHLLSDAAEKGEPRSAYLLGLIYVHGLGVHPDRQKGIDWILSSAERGHPPALEFLGRAYHDGILLPRDEIRALDFSFLAAKGELTSAQHFLGRILLEKNASEEEFERAQQWIERAAKKEYGPAQNDLAFFYLQGGDIGKAVRWLRLAARQGETSSYHNLWNLHRDGAVTPENDRELTTWLRAAARSDPLAQEQLAERYLMGSGHDSHLNLYARRRLALYWYHSSGRQGRLEAQEKLGELYTEDSVQEPDPVLAAVWNGLAAKNGSTTAAALHEDLNHKISREERTRAERIGKSIESWNTGGARDKGFIFSPVSNFFSELPESLCKKRSNP